MSSKLIDERPLILLPSLAKKIGLNEAVFMQQIHFWLLMKKNVKDGYYWTYNTHDDWLEQFPFWSKSTLRRIIDSLIEKDLIICGRFNKNNYDKTKWYRINYDKLKEVTKDMEVFDGKATVKNEKATVQNEKATVQNEKATVQNEQIDVFKMDKPIPKTITKNNLKELKDSLSEDKSSDVSEVIKFYKTLKTVPKVISFSDKRKKHINARLSEYGLEVVKETLFKASESDFLISNIGKQNFYDFDWIINPNNFLKILEDKYKNKNDYKEKTNEMELGDIFS